MTERLELIARHDALETAATWIGDACRRLGLSSRIAGQFNLVLEEILTNLVEHSHCDNNKNIHVYVDLSAISGGATLRICDEGAPFDPITAADPDLTADLEHRKIGGLGLYLVRQLGDELEYEYKDGWNVFHFRKRLDGGVTP